RPSVAVTQMCCRAFEWPRGRCAPQSFRSAVLMALPAMPAGQTEGRMTTGILRAGIVALAAGAGTLLISQAPASAQESDDTAIRLDQITVTTPLRRESSLERSTS